MDRLGAERYGVWVLGGALAGLVTAAGTGMDAAVMRVVAATFARGQSTRAVVSTALAVSVTEAVLLALVVGSFAGAISEAAGVSPAGRPEATACLRLLLAWYVLARVTGVVTAGVFGTGRSQRVAVSRLTGVAVFALAAATALLLGGGLVALAGCQIGGQLAALALVVARQPHEVRPGSRAARGEILRSLWRFGRPRQLSSGALLVALQGERVLVGVIAASTASGRLGAASTAVASIATVVVHGASPLTPDFTSRGVRDGAPAVRAAHARAAARTALAAAAALGALVAAGEPFMDAWVGPEVAVASYVAVLAPGFYAWAVTAVGFSAAQALGDPGIEGATAWRAALANLGLAAVLLMLLGTAAAGVATSLALIGWALAFRHRAAPLLGRVGIVALAGPAALGAALAATVAVAGRAVVDIDGASRPAQAGLAVAFALTYLALYLPLARRLARRRQPA